MVLSLFLQGLGGGCRMCGGNRLQEGGVPNCHTLR